jgi:Secretion system C-terminal sorting domain
MPAYALNLLRHAPLGRLRWSHLVHFLRMALAHVQHPQCHLLPGRMVPATLLHAVIAYINMINSRSIIYAVFLSLTFVSGSRAQQQWEVTHHTSSVVGEGIYSYDAVSCHGEVVVVACEKNVVDSGLHTQIFVFLRSNNGGQTWQETDPPLLQEYGISAANYNINAIQVIDSNNLVACGGSGLVLRSFDGGITWSNQSIIDTNPNDASPTFSCIHFSDPGTGIITPNISQLGTPDLYTTTDSGSHWNSTTLPSDPILTISHSYGSGMYRVASSYTPSVDTLDGMPVININFTGNEIYTTRDNWNSYDSVALKDSYSLNPFVYYSFGMGDTFVVYKTYTGANSYTGPDPERTTDGGLNWQESTLMDSTFMVTEMSPLDQNPVFLVGEELDTTKVNKMFVSFDHGESWQTKITPSANDTPILWIKNVAVTGNGEAVAIIVAKRGTQHTVEQDYLGYLAPIQESVEAPIPSPSIFAIYPNPATNILNLESPSGNISILDPLGRSYTVPRNGDALDISSLPPGVYFVSDGVSRAKFVKE